jgi:hypothetical protein
MFQVTIHNYRDGSIRKENFKTEKWATSLLNETIREWIDKGYTLFHLKDKRETFAFNDESKTFMSVIVRFV